MSTLLFDIEADGLNATKVHCIVTIDTETEEVKTYGPDALHDGVASLLSADRLVGHNIIGYQVGNGFGGEWLPFNSFWEIRGDQPKPTKFGVEDYRRNPDLIVEYLPECLHEYYAALRKLGKTVDDASTECARCKAMPIDYTPTRASKATEISECGVRDLR